MTSIIPLLLAIASDPFVRVEGSNTCPTAQQVMSEFPAWLLTRPSDADSHTLTIHGDADGIHLTLTCNGLVTTETIEPGPGCVDIAQKIAAKVAVWEIMWCPAQPRWILEWGAAARAGFVVGESAGFAPGALLEVVLRNTHWRVGPRLFVTAAWNDTALALGGVYWTRPTVGLGLIHGWKGAVSFDLHEEFLGGAVIAQGHDTASNIATRGRFELGLSAGVRVGSAGGRWRLWADLAAVYWPERDKFGLRGSPVLAQDVPDRELILSLGVTFPTAL